MEEARPWLRVGALLILIAVVLAAVPISTTLWAGALAWEPQSPSIHGSVLLCPRSSAPYGEATVCPPGASPSISWGSGLQHPVGQFRLDWVISVSQYAGQHVYFVLGYPAALGIGLDARLNRTGLNPVYLSVEMPPVPNGISVGGSVYFHGESVGDNASYFMELQDRDVQSASYTAQNQTLAVAYQLDTYYRPSLDALIGTWSGDLFLALYIVAGIGGILGILSITRSRRLRGAHPADVPHQGSR